MNLGSISSFIHRHPLIKWLLRGIALLAFWIVLHCTLITIDGFADTVSAANPADAEVIMGNEVFPNATPSLVLRERLQKGLDIFQSGGAQRIICSGGRGPKGLWEAEVMRLAGRSRRRPSYDYRG